MVRHSEPVRSVGNDGEFLREYGMEGALLAGYSPGEYIEQRAKDWAPFIIGDLRQKLDSINADPTLANNSEFPDTSFPSAPSISEKSVGDRAHAKPSIRSVGAVLKRLVRRPARHPFDRPFRMPGLPAVGGNRRNLAAAERMWRRRQLAADIGGLPVRMYSEGREIVSRGVNYVGVKVEASKKYRRQALMLGAAVVGVLALGYAANHRSGNHEASPSRAPASSLDIPSATVAQSHALTPTIRSGQAVSPPEISFGHQEKTITITIHHGETVWGDVQDVLQARHAHNLPQATAGAVEELRRLNASTDLDHVNDGATFTMSNSFIDQMLVD